MIAVEHVSKSYGTVRALDDVSFQVPAGEIVGLVGKNGAGKSTALKILSGQLLPSSGEVRLDGYSITDDVLEVRRRIGFLPEAPPLYPEMTVRAYLRFTAGLHGLFGAAAQTNVARVMAQTSLEAVAAEPLRVLSRGFQQRVAIAQALVHEPPVVLLDEPMAGLDPLQIVQTRELIRGLKPRHTVIFSSHILGEITNLCDRLLLIDQGRVRAQGTEHELREARGRGQPLLVQVRGEEARLRQALSTIAGLQVQLLPGAVAGIVRARLAHDRDVREQVADACAKAGLALRELRAESPGLEDLFLDLLGEPRPGDSSTGGAATGSGGAGRVGGGTIRGTP